MISRYASVCSVLGLTAAPVVLAVPADVSPVEAAEGSGGACIPSAKGAVSFKLNPALQKQDHDFWDPRLHSGGGFRRAAPDSRLWLVFEKYCQRFICRGTATGLPCLPHCRLLQDLLRLSLPGRLFLPTIIAPCLTRRLSGTGRGGSRTDFLAFERFQLCPGDGRIEKTWEDFLIGLGYPRDKAIRFIPNPAFAAWWNMGNLEGHGGPPPSARSIGWHSWGKRIVSRMEQLGMTPVLQGYVGFVPADFAENVRMKGLKLIPQGNGSISSVPGLSTRRARHFPSWRRIGIVPFARCTVFPEKNVRRRSVSRRGEQGEYQCDTGGGGRPEGHAEASPGSTWVIQAWGGNPSRELLNGMDPKHALVLQLTKDMADGGKNLRTF